MSWCYSTGARSSWTRSSTSSRLRRQLCWRHRELCLWIRRRRHWARVWLRRCRWSIQRVLPRLEMTLRTWSRRFKRLGSCLLRSQTRIRLRKCSLRKMTRILISRRSWACRWQLQRQVPLSKNPYFWNHSNFWKIAVRTRTKWPKWSLKMP